jgi:hypothetical protein
MGYPKIKLERIKQGLCVDCGAATIYKKDRCEPHHREYRNRANRSNILWRKRNPEKAAEYQRRTDRKRADKLKAYHAKYHQEHRSRLNEARRKWALVNPDKIKESMRKYREHNKEKIRAGIRRWMQANPDKVKAQWTKQLRANRNHLNELRRKRYHANLHESRRLCLVDKQRRNKVRGSHTAEQWLSRVSYYGWRCVWCKKPLNDLTLTKDHIKPVSKGGADLASNLAPACRSCNAKKRTRLHCVPMLTVL